MPRVCTNEGCAQRISYRFGRKVEASLAPVLIDRHTRVQLSLERRRDRLCAHLLQLDLERRIRIRTSLERYIEIRVNL